MKDLKKVLEIRGHALMFRRVKYMFLERLYSHDEGEINNDNLYVR